MREKKRGEVERGAVWAFPHATGRERQRVLFSSPKMEREREREWVCVCLSS